MERTMRLMGVLAHPDDESLGFGGTFAKYAAEGIDTTLVTATRGERGWAGPPEDFPGRATLGRIRENELRRAAAALSIGRVILLDEIDGELTRRPAQELIHRITSELRRWRPDVVITFGPDGVYGHPDHVAISQCTTAAVVAAADPSYQTPGTSAAHRVSKVYYRIWTPSEEAVYRSVFGDVSIEVNGERRSWCSWPSWAISAQIDTSDYWSEVSEAVDCHQSQIGGTDGLARLSAGDRRALWSTQQFYRAISTIETGHELETDLFFGLRQGSGSKLLAQIAS
jgi:LmbE family N-acetylglucosaminyl deacetylase